MSIELRPTWLDGWVKKPHALFSPKLAREHYSLLVDALGENWFSKNLNTRSNHHPLILQWCSKREDSFLDVNTLAADIALVKNKLNFKIVLDDYKDKKYAAANRHVLHIAALFERAEAGSVQKFFTATHEGAPDFLVVHKGVEIPIEAKILEISQPSKSFSDYAGQLTHKMSSFLADEENQFSNIYVVLKNCLYRPDFSQIKELVRKNLRTGVLTRIPSESFNIIIEPILENPKIVSSFNRILVLSPKSDTENTRILDRAKNASKQLYRFHKKESPGMCCIQIGPMQEVDPIFGFFRRKFEAGQFSGISAIMLNQCGTWPHEDLSTYIDGIRVLVNTKAAHQIPGSLNIKAIGQSVQLPETPDNQANIPCYYVGYCSAKRIDPNSNVVLDLPKIHSIAVETLA